MMTPHFLDALFQGGTRGFEQRLLASTPFKLAIEKAAVAFREQEMAMRQHPGLRGASPAQMARVAFLDVLNSDISGGVGAAG